MTTYIEEIVKRAIDILRNERPIFHSEADFQHSLAWKIKELDNKFQIRLEKRIDIDNEKNYFDIIILSEKEVCAIEVKYLTRKFNKREVNGEIFELQNHQAHNINRWRFCKDIERLEKFVLSNDKIYKGKQKIGLAILLTNDKAYWDKPKRKNVSDIKFRLHEGQCLTGKLYWMKKISEKIKRRYKEIILKGKYEIGPNDWKEYSIIKDSDGEVHTFKYIMIKVSKEI